MEAQLGRFDEARRLFQQGAWAGVGEIDAARIWQAWALLEVRTARNRPEIAQAMVTARRYFGNALEADRNSVPTYVAWALVEERFGDAKRACEILEFAVRGQQDDVVLWRT